MSLSFIHGSTLVLFSGHDLIYYCISASSVPLTYFWRVTCELLCAGVRLFSGSLRYLPYDSWFQLVRVSVMYFVHQLLFCTHTLGGICYSQNEHTIEFIRLRMDTDISVALQLNFQITQASFQHGFYTCARVHCELPASFQKACDFYALRSRAPSRRQNTHVFGSFRVLLYCFRVFLGR